MNFNRNCKKVTSKLQIWEKIIQKYPVVSLEIFFSIFLNLKYAIFEVKLQFEQMQSNSLSTNNNKTLMEILSTLGSRIEVCPE